MSRRRRQTRVDTVTRDVGPARAAAAGADVAHPGPPFAFYAPPGGRWPRFCRSLRAAPLVLAPAALLVLRSLLPCPQPPPVTLPTVAHLPAFAEVHSIIRGEVADEN